MKELSIEEKAKRYDESIEIAKEINNERQAQPFNVMTRVFPELKESEDERIRKELIFYFQEEIPQCSIQEHADKMKQWIAWLEKQPTPQIRTGLEWVNTIDDACDERYSEEYAHGEYCHEQSFKWGFQEGVDWLEKQGEQKPADEEMIEALRTEYEKGKADAIAEMQNPAWSEEDEYCLAGAIETELYMLDVVTGVKKFDVGNSSIKEECTRELAWLKSLKERVQPQNTWKPSDEQMIELRRVISGCSYDIEPLIEIEEHLKKLKA